MGKLIVATGAGQSAVLERILVHGTENGVVDLRMMSGEEAMRMEPSLRCTQALFSPSTGIVDSHAFMTALQVKHSDDDASCRMSSRLDRVSTQNLGAKLKFC